MPELKTVTEEGCPEDRAYCSDFDPSGKKCKYYKTCKPSDYEPLTINVYKFRGNREGLASIFKAIQKGIDAAKNNQFTLKLTLKEVSLNANQETKEAEP
jgi:hypothetical protein